MAKIVQQHIERMGTEVINQREARIGEEGEKESNNDPNFVKVKERLPPTHPPTHPKPTAPHSNRLLLLHPPTHPSRPSLPCTTNSSLW